MDIRSRDQLKQHTRQRLQRAAFDPRKLALIHTAAAVALSLVLTVLNFVLTRQLDNAGGLAGLGTRAILSTAQALISILSVAVMPFWEMGFLRAGMGLARQEQTEPSILFAGFRKWGGVLRLTLIQALLYAAILFLSLQVGSTIFFLTPFAEPLMENVGGMTEAGIGVLDEEVMVALVLDMIPLYLIVGIVCCILMIPVFYRLRMASYVLLDSENPGALRALGQSHRLMRNNRFALLRLDLSFWWFYALQLLSSLIGYGDSVLSALGIPLHMNGDVAFFLFYCLHLLCQLGLAWWAGSFVQTTYAVAYDSLKQQYEETEKPIVRNFPWDFLP